MGSPVTATKIRSVVTVKGRGTAMIDALGVAYRPNFLYLGSGLANHFRYRTESLQILFQFIDTRLVRSRGEVYEQFE